MHITLCTATATEYKTTNLFKHSPVQVKIVFSGTFIIMFLLICLSLVGVVFEERLHSVHNTTQSIGRTVFDAHIDY